MICMRERARIGILGGTFDPVHYAHLAIAEEVYCALHLTRVLFVPAGQPPHKLGEPITPAEHRVAMLELAIRPNPHFSLSLVDIERDGPSYTVDTLRLLRNELGADADLYFVIGGDSLRDLPTWYDPVGILDQATIVALLRPGYADVEAERAPLVARLSALEQRLIVVEGPRMDLSSTELRRRVATGRPIKYQTPDEVEDYIRRHRLYQKIEGRQEDAHAAHAL
jgi:nicotinate-nucleotide adenylyltransferase